MTSSLTLVSQFSLFVLSGGRFVARHITPHRSIARPQARVRNTVSFPPPPLFIVLVLFFDEIIGFNRIVEFAKIGLGFAIELAEPTISP